MVPWDPCPLPVMSLPARLVASRGVRMLPQPWRLFSRAADEAALRGIRKVLCVAEKNDAARGIADLLSNSRMRRVGTRCVSLPLVHVPMGLAELAGGSQLSRAPPWRPCSSWSLVCVLCRAWKGCLSLSVHMRVQNVFILWTSTACPHGSGSLGPIFLQILKPCWDSAPQLRSPCRQLSPGSELSSGGSWCCSQLCSVRKSFQELKPSVPSQKAPLLQRQQVSGVH